MTLDGATLLELAIPLAIALGAWFAWDAWVRPASPPRFQPYSIRRAWQVDPLALLDGDLRRGHLMGAITTVHDQLLRELTLRHGMTATEIAHGPAWLGRPSETPVERACRVVRAMVATYRIAGRAEDPQRTDLWSQWRRPVWRDAAERRFRAEFAEAEAVWPALSEAS